MFTPMIFAEQLDLNISYSHIQWDSPPAMPDTVEFLDRQESLFYGVLYLAATEEDAIRFLSEEDLTIYPGAILVIANASTVWPEEMPERKTLSIFGYKESVGRIYNRFVFLNRKGLYSGKPMTFDAVWQEIISSPSLTDPMIFRYLSNIPELGRYYYQVAVISFQNSDAAVPYVYLAGQIKAAIPNCCTAVEGKQIIALLSFDDVRLTSAARLGHLLPLLEKYKAYMALSNASSKLTDIRPNYFITRRALDLIYDMELTEERIVDAGRFGLYSVIDMAQTAFSSAFSNYAGFMLLAHPSVFSLIKHDRAQGDNLFELLYQYLRNDRNVSKTAAMLYMHRNTVMKKIHIVRDLIQVDLDDNDMRQSMLLSCILFKYIRQIPQQSMWLSRDYFPPTSDNR